MRTLSLTAACLLAACAVALAQDGPRRDGDDSRSLVDIAQVRSAFDRANDRMAHIVRVHRAISPRNFRNAVDPKGPPGSVCVLVWTRRIPWEASPNYDVCVSADRARRKLVASVSRIGAGGKVRRVGRARAQLTTSRRLVIRFDPDLIGRPASYRWSVHSTTFERGCTRRGCQDHAPRTGRSMRAAVGARAS